MTIATAPVSSSPAKKATQPREATMPADHPKYTAMVPAAIGSLKERGGFFRQALIKYYLKATYKINNAINQREINARVNIALKSEVKAGTLKQAKGTGSFHLGEKKEVAKPKVKKPETAATKKPKSPKKKTTTKKVPTAKTPTNKATTTKPKKVKTPKKAATAKRPKKTKSPAKKSPAVKPKTTRPPRRLPSSNMDA